MASDEIEEHISKLERRLTSIEDQLKNVEGLLALLAEKFGATTTEIGTVLGVDRSQVSRKYPTSNVESAEVEVTNMGEAR